MVVLYTFTMFVGALLLFVVQPMVAKLLLPTLGGSATVWTTCMLFFQTVLLAGYGYAHVSARLLSPRRSGIVHLALMLLAATTLPIALPELDVEPSGAPTSWLLLALSLSIGLPFFAVSATAPLLSHLFAQTDHHDAPDPYFLYAASNLGSLVALLGYPTVVEPWAGVAQQAALWTVLYLTLIVSIGGCWLAASRRPGIVVVPVQSAPPTWLQRTRWMLWAAIPSSLMLGVTAHVTTDLAPVPLLWVVPLALYLATFVLVFARRPLLAPDGARTVLPIVCLVAFGLIETIGGTLAVGLHLANFFLFALWFHSALARERPAASRLTEYFLLISLGGAVGGLFNALVAPLMFDLVLEYYVVLAVAVAMMAPRDDGRHPVRIAATCLSIAGFLWACELVWPLWICVAVVALVVIIARPSVRNVTIASVLLIGVGVRFAEPALVTERSFFAAYKVQEREQNDLVFRSLTHGTTRHGVQARGADASRVPRSYHHPTGPVGDVFETVQPQSVLVVGLGVGAIAAYGGRGTRISFYEIDPLVYELASRWFTYLSDCGERCEVAIGDGRQLLAQTGQRFDVIVLDAYNSSGVPTHLLTREALRLYLSRLAPGGLLLFNVSNRYLAIDRVVGTLCEDAGISAWMRTFDPPWRASYDELIDPSQFIVAAPDTKAVAPFERDPQWKKPPTMQVVWTDDFTNLLRIVHW